MFVKIFIHIISECNNKMWLIHGFKIQYLCNFDPLGFVTTYMYLTSHIQLCQNRKRKNKNKQTPKLRYFALLH